ncbi:MAG: DNA translocase FtsK, partial [Pirellulaceae bacterium]
LLGNGDMLFLWPGTSTLLRGQGTYLSDEEINKIVDCVSTGEQHFVNELVNMKVTKPGEPGEDRLAAMRKKDDMYESAVDVVIREGRGSVSLLQRALGIGYGRAARLIDFMAEDGIVGQYAGSQAREVIITVEDWEAMQAGEGVEEPKGKSGSFNANSAPAKKRNNKVRLDEVPEPEETDEGADSSFEADEDEELDADSSADGMDQEEEEDTFAESDYEAESA